MSGRLKMEHGQWEQLVIFEALFTVDLTTSLWCIMIDQSRSTELTFYDRLWTELSLSSAVTLFQPQVLHVISNKAYVTLPTNSKCCYMLANGSAVFGTDLTIVVLVTFKSNILLLLITDLWK